ncbi:MAG: type III-A CRISPR-associated protein Cas10/Csm1, partial [Draconibacterium sp.]|nr:type III-A CRISPR-associated protein Cas10/Csm1 [Draconibacterium sp.]
MKNIRQQIYLGALLHDIGKFYQRADKKFSDKKNELSEYSKNIPEDICPINEHGRFGYQHVIWTNEFFEKFNDKLQQIPGVQENRYDKSDTDNIVTFACNHHKPQTLLQSFITIGDWWSAGIDRRNANKVNEKDYAGKSINWDKNRYKTIPLFSVFNTVNPYNNEDRTFSSAAFKLKRLSVERDDIFTSQVNKVEDGISENEYKKLWDNFAEEFEMLPTDSFDGFTESLLYLLKKYTWCIPSNTMDMANVSLFEHLKTTAAFADSIYTFYSDGNADKFTFNKVNNRLTVNDGVHPVLLVGGDISGIQKFIYNIASQKAAVSMKGRSFYLQLLIDSIIQKVITHADIKATIGHVVYSSGGKFYMILPNTQKVKIALNNIKTEIEKELWAEHKGKLAINLSYIGFAFVNNADNKISIEGKTKNTDLGNLWRSLAEKLNAQKNQKFKSLLTSSFFEQNIVDDKIKMCAVTGEELKKGEWQKLKGTDEYVSKAVAQQTEIGIALKDADYLMTYRNPKDESKYLSNRSQAQIKVVGVDNYMFDKIELTKDDADFRQITSADVSRIVLFNNTNPLAAKL